MEGPQDTGGVVRGVLEVHVADMPELLHAMRCEMAQLLREAALDEVPEVAAFANRVAAEFESGQVQ